MQRARLTPTQNDCNNFVRWMAAENPPGDWYHFNNPLNCGLNDNSPSGTGSYVDLNIAATYTAQVLAQSNMASIWDALNENSNLAVFSTGCAYSAWSTGGYHNQPGYILSIPEPAYIAGPNSFPIVPLGPSPTPTPPPPPVPSTPKEQDMITHDPHSNGYWTVRSDGNVYTYDGAQYIGPLPKYLTQWGIGTAANPVIGIEADGVGGFVLETDPPGAAQPNLYHITADGAFAK